MNFIRALLGRGALFSLGLGLKYLLDWPFDYLLYPIVMCTYDWLWGGLIMTILSIPLNYAQIRLYDVARLDFFTLEAAKSFRDDEHGGWVARTMKRSRVFAFLWLSWQDPFYAAVYFRNGSGQYNGMSKRDWHIFLTATVIANGYWIALLAAGMATIGMVQSELTSALEFIGLEFLVTYIGVCTS